MKMTYDPEADALDIRLREGHHECRTVRLSDDIALDFAEGDVLVAIEVLGVSALGVNREHPEVVLDRIKGVTAGTA